MQLRKLSRQRFVEAPHSVIPNLFRDLVFRETVVGGSGLVLGKIKGTGWPLSGSPFAEKNSCMFQDVSCKLHQKAVARQRLAVLRKKPVLPEQGSFLRSWLKS